MTQILHNEKKNDRIAPWLNEIFKSIHSPDFKVINPGKLAAEHGVSLTRANRHFLRNYERTLFALWGDRRFEKAKEMLSGSGLSSKEIMFSLGFRQASHFSAWFKRRTGIPPRVFRLTIKNR